MKKFNKLNTKQQFKTIKSKQGSFAAALIAVAVAIAIIFNLIVSQLPEGLSSIDISGRDLYSISETSVELLQNLSDEVRLVVLAEDGSVDNRIEKFIDKYAGLSDKVSVEYIDPIQYPSALQTYEAEQDNIVVICQATDKQAVIKFSDIIQSDESGYYMTGQYTETAFDAEGQLTSAIDYVTTDSGKTAYTLGGHNETDLSATVLKQMEKSHFIVNSLNLLTDGSIPEDCDLLICNAPTVDLADDELAMLEEYLAKGGHLTLLLSEDEADTPNFDSLMKTYGITKKAGYLADYGRSYQNNAYIFFPELSTESEITSEFNSNNLALIYNSRALEETTPERSAITTESFMTSSEQGAVINGESETEGKFSVAVCAREEIDDNTTANLTVYAGQSIIADDIVAAFANVANLDVFMNGLTNGFEDINNISIEAKSLETTYNTVRAGGLWSILFVILIPLTLVILGLVRWLRRRKL